MKRLVWNMGGKRPCVSNRAGPETEKALRRIADFGIAGPGISAFSIVQFDGKTWRTEAVPRNLCSAPADSNKIVLRDEPGIGCGDRVFSYFQCSGHFAAGR